MATRAKQQYYGDGNNIVKNKRTFELSQDILDKIEEAGGGTIETIKVNGITQPVVDKTVNIPVPLVEDNLNSYSTTNALSANQGRLLQDAINNFQTIGHFLSLWNAETGLPVDEPSTSPYTYNTGDYYIVSKVASRNFRPDGSEYISGQASSAEETADLAVNDFYFFNGTNWFHLSNEGKSLAIDDALSTSSTNAVENRVVTNALNGKANVEDLENFYTKTEVDDKIDDAVQDNVKDGVLTIQKNGADQGTFSANQATDTTINLTVNKIDVGLSNVDNTSDVDKPISTATQTALDGLSDRIDALETGDIQDIKDDVADLQENKLDKTDLGDATLTVQKNGTDVGTFTANSKTDTTINLELTKADVGLGNVDNTADIDKPISTATQEALDTKADKTDLDNYYTKTEVGLALADKADKATTYTKTEVDDLLDEKQDVLTSGNGISITNKVIANTGVLTVNGETGDVTVDEPIVYTAGNGIDITDNEISADTTVLATKADLDSKQDTLVSGVNIKTINNESLLGTGDITISAPTYTAGENITIDQNNEISAVDTTYNAGKGIIIGDIIDRYETVQGPCDVGFHIPLSSEFGSLKNMMEDFGGQVYTVEGVKTYLHMPLAGRLFGSTGNLTDSGVEGYYRGGNSVGNYHRASCLEIGSPYFGPIVAGSYYLATGYSVRPFKDEPVIPDSSWTQVYAHTAGGIYYNSTLGLISLSSDGTNWLTIADKNLGATVVYNNGDTLSESNCGKFYQRGNNYGFDRSGAVSKSPTKVNASSYGPGEYSSSTFITDSYTWMTTDNETLWANPIIIKNAISNTGVLSVNGQTGDVIIDDNIKIFYVDEPALTSGGRIANADAFKNILKRLISDSKHIAYITNKHAMIPGESILGSVMQIISHSGDLYDENNWTFGFIYIGFPLVENRELFKYYGCIEINDGTASIANITADKINFAPSNSGAVGQVLTKTSGNYEWKDAGTGDGDIKYEDFEFATMTGTVIENLSATKSISADTTLTAGTSLKEGMQYLVDVTNTDTAKHTVTFGSESVDIEAGESKKLVFLATSSSTLELQTCSGGGAVSTGITNDTTGTTTTVTKIRAGLESEYEVLATHDATTIYHLY